MQQKLEYLSTNAQNPFKHVKNWVKGEILEIEAILEAITMKEAMIARKEKSQQKKKNNQKDVEKMS